MCWMPDEFQQALTQYLQAGERVAFVGIGQELCGDDAAGVLVAQRLREQVGANEQWCIIDAGPSPENFAGALCRFQPSLMILIDAAQLDAEVGSIHLLDWRMTGGLSASSHTLPLNVVCTYLTQTMECRIWLIAIQAACTEFDRPISREVESAVQQIVTTLVGLFGLQERGIAPEPPRP